MNSKKEMIILCCKILEKFEQNLTVTQQFEAGTIFVLAAQENILLEDEIENIISSSIMPSTNKEEADKRKYDVLFASEYIPVMKCYSTVINQQTYVEGENIGLREQMVKYLKAMSSPFVK